MVLAAPSATYAATKTWAGGNGTQNWNVNGNWLPSGVPGPSDDVVITGGNNTIRINTSIDVNSITINGACRRTIAPNDSGYTIRIRGDLNINSSNTGGVLRLSETRTEIGGQINLNNSNFDLDGNDGILILNAASGNKTHTLSGVPLEKVVFNDGLVGYWNLDESASSFADNSGYGNNGALSGTNTFATPPAVAFTNVRALSFNGTSNYVSLGTTNFPANNAAQTISVWFKLNSTAGTQNIVALVNAGSSSAVQLGVKSGTLAVWTYGGTNLISRAAPSDGAWHHLAYTYDGTTERLYLDGAVTTATGTHQTATPNAAYLGTYNGTAELLNGALDEVRIYNRALSSREIADMARGRMPNAASATHTLSGPFATESTRGDFVIASGHVTGGGAVTVTGSWLNYGGRFSGTATVTLAATGAETLLSGGQTFAAIRKQGAGTYTIQDRLWVKGSLLITAGALNGSSYTIHTGALEADSPTYFQPSSSTVVFDGSNDFDLTTRYFCGVRIEDPTETGLVGYWKLDEEGGPTLRDWSGNENSGTLSSNGSAWTSPSTTIGFDNASALSLDGTSGYVSLGANNLPATNAVQSFSVWAKVTSASGTQNIIALSNGSNAAVQLGIRDGALTVWSWGGAAIVSGAVPSTGVWHHLAYTWDGTNNRLYVDGTLVGTTTTAHQSAAVSQAYLGTYNGAGELYSGDLDDVRIYNVALTATQVAELAAGRYAGTGGVSTITVAGTEIDIPNSSGGCNGNLGLNLAIDSGNFYTADQAVNVRATSGPVTVGAGTLHIGSGSVSVAGGLTVHGTGTLLMDESGGILRPGANTSVTINGTLRASDTNAVIQRNNGSERFAFTVGSTATARPVLDISGLAVRDTDSNGMWINANTGAVTAFSSFKNIDFRRGTGTFVKIYASSLFLSSNGFVFGFGEAAAALPAYAVTLAGNGTADGETRAIFGGATCHSSKTDSSGRCLKSWLSDDDPDDDGVGNTPATNGAVAQFVRAAASDTAGSIVGFPTAAFDWNTFTYYSTYVAYRDANGTADRIYVRGQDGNAKSGYAQAYWETPSGETIIGTPRWNTVGTTHYLYVATASGKIYRLIDNTASGTLSQDNSGNWAGANNPYNCNCTVVTPLTMDATNLYWGGTVSGNQRVFTLGQTSRSQPMGSPIAITPTITSAEPSLWTSAGTSYLFLGLVGNVMKIQVVPSQTITAVNNSPGSASVLGRVAVGSTYVYAGDDGGTMRALNLGASFGAAAVWTFASGAAIRSSAYYDFGGAVVHYGTDGGNLYAVNGSTGALLTGFPYLVGSNDAITTAPLYIAGVVVVGTSTGKLHFVDRNNGTTGPELIRAFYFGPTQAVSGVGYDASSSRFMVSTADSTTNAGHLYYFDAAQFTDPTPGTL